jgi:hypothetical protein
VIDGDVEEPPPHAASAHTMENATDLLANMARAAIAVHEQASFGFGYPEKWIW